MSLKKYSLKDVCEKITDGTHHSPPIVPDGVPYVTAKHIKETGIHFFDDPWFISKASHAEIYSRCDPKPGDVLYIKDGATTGVAAVNEYDFPFSMLSSVALLRPMQDRCHPQFLAAWLNAPAVKEKHLQRMGGAAIKRLTLSKIKEFKIPLPPLAEQKRIAGILDAADALRAKRRESLAQLDALLQSTFLHLFGDPVTNPIGWEQAELGSLIEAGDKINYGVVQPGDDWPDGKPLVRVGDFVGGELKTDGLKLIDPAIERKYRRSRLNGRELLVSCVGSIGMVCKVPSHAKGYNIARAVARVPLRDDISREFMIHCLRSEAVQRHFLKETRTVSQPTLNISLIKTAPVIQPSVDLQRRFTAIVESVERQKAQMRSHLAELDALFASLQSRAFNGEL